MTPAWPGNGRWKEMDRRRPDRCLFPVSNLISEPQTNPIPDSAMWPNLAFTFHSLAAILLGRESDWPCCRAGAGPGAEYKLAATHGGPATSAQWPIYRPNEHALCRQPNMKHGFCQVLKYKYDIENRDAQGDVETQHDSACNNRSGPHPLSLLVFAPTALLSYFLFPISLLILYFTI